MFITPTSDTNTTWSDVCQNEEFTKAQVPKLKVYLKKLEYL